METLGAVAADRFHLLVDEDCLAFRAFGCFDNRPMHGLFLIDSAGVVRASYTGDRPFDDLQAVAEQVNALVETGTGAATR